MPKKVTLELSKLTGRELSALKSVADWKGLFATYWGNKSIERLTKLGLVRVSGNNVLMTHLGNEYLRETGNATG